MYNFLVDSHCHLNMLSQESNRNIEDIILKAKENDVKILNNISTEESEFDSIINISEKFDNIYSTIGIHPSNIESNIISLDKLLLYSKNKKVIAIGESGLEYHYEPIDKIKQKKSFEIHIEAARKSNIPLVIHSRNADDDMIDILKSEMKNGDFKFVLHCFSSGEKLCWTGLDLGGYISLSGIVTFKNADELRGIIKNVPLKNIILETDSPFLAPIPFRGKVNEPANVKNIANYLVDFLKIDFNILEDYTTRNFITLFNKVNIK